MSFPGVYEALEDIKSELVLLLWDTERDRHYIDERDLTRLGATQLYPQKPTIMEAYRRMIEHRVPGIPVVDERRKFLGITDKDKIVQEVITRLLEKGQV